MSWLPAPFTQPLRVCSLPENDITIITTPQNRKKSSDSLSCTSSSSSVETFNVIISAFFQHHKIFATQTTRLLRDHFVLWDTRAPASEPGSIMCFIFKFSQTFILRLNSLEERKLLETVFSLEATGRRMACKCKCLCRDLKDPPKRQLLSQSIPILHLLLFLVLEFFCC